MLENLEGSAAAKGGGKGKVPQFPSSLRKPPPPCKQLSPIKLKCGGQVHRHRGELSDRADDTVYACLRTTEPNGLCSHVFGPGGLVPLSNRDRFVDLGCGLGDTLMAARMIAPECECVGVELGAENVAHARAAIAADDRFHDIRIIHGSIDDCFSSSEHDNMEIVEQVGLAKATVVFLYLGEWANLKLRARLLDALPVNAVIISRSFTMGEAWPPDSKVCTPESFMMYAYRVTEMRKNDPMLKSDDDLHKRYGSFWRQPPPAAYVPVQIE